MGDHFPVGEKSGNFDQVGKVTFGQLKKKILAQNTGSWGFFFRDLNFRQLLIFVCEFNCI